MKEDVMGSVWREPWLLFFVSGGCLLAQVVTNAPLDVNAVFTPSGYMGDGEQGGHVQMRPVAGEKPRPGDTDNLCYKITYQPGAKARAGVYWLFPADNWRANPGRSIRGATHITFWAVGARGGEIVEFKAGGLRGQAHEDTFEVSIGSVSLTADWKKFSIDLKGSNLTSVVGGFAWIAT